MQSGMSSWEIYKFMGVPALTTATWKQRLRINGFEVPRPISRDDDYFFFAAALLAVERDGKTIRREEERLWDEGEMEGRVRGGRSRR